MLKTQSEIELLVSKLFHILSFIFIDHFRMLNIYFKKIIVCLYENDGHGTSGENPRFGILKFVLYSFLHDP